MLPEHERREGWTSPPSLYRPDRSIDCPRRGRSRRSTDRPRGSTVCLPRCLAFESSPQARRPRAKADRRTQSAMTAKHLAPPVSHVEHGRLIRNHQTCTGATLSICRHTATRTAHLTPLQRWRSLPAQQRSAEPWWLPRLRRQPRPQDSDCSPVAQ